MGLPNKFRSTSAYLRFNVSSVQQTNCRLTTILDQYRSLTWPVALTSGFSRPRMMTLLLWLPHICLDFFRQNVFQTSSGFEVDFHTRIVGGVSIVFWNLWELGLGGLGGGVRVGEGQSKKSIRSILLYLRELQDVLDFRIIARKKTLMDLVPAPFSNKFFSNLLSLKRSIAITRISLMFSIMFCDCHCEFSKCLFVWLEPVVMCCDVLWCVVMCCDVLLLKNSFIRCTNSHRCVVRCATASKNNNI